MIKKIPIITFMVITFVFSLAPNLSNVAQAADAKQGSVSIPVTNGLTGSGNSAKTFYLDLPSGVTGSAIKSGTLKYSGTNSVVGGIAIENGKIKLTLKGTAKDETFSVEGRDGNPMYPFVTNPGNSIWRYADGRRWQINNYDEYRDINTFYNATATDYSTPSTNPPRKTVTTKSITIVPPNSATWFRKDQTVVPFSSVIQSSIKMKLETLLDGAKGSGGLKNGKIVITYQVPTANVRPEQVSESFEKGQWVEGRLYFVNQPYYYEAQAKLTSYSYAGTVTFDYSPPDQATLNGTATLEKPSPNPIKLEGSKVDVKINVKGELLGYTDSSNIEEWVFYAKEKNGTAKADMKKEYSKLLTASKSFDFAIPASRVVNDNFKQDYTLTVVIRFKKPVVTKTGTITSLEQSMEVSAGVYKKDNPVSYPSVPSTPTKPEGKPPIARITAPKYIKAGSDMMVYGGNSSDPDGYITDYAWGTPGAEGGIENTARGYVWYTRDKVGETFPITLTVVDNDGMTGSTSTEVTVIEPRPSADLEISGSLKQNRKTTLTNSSSSPTRFPIIKSRTQVTISAVSGGTNAAIKYSGSLAELESKDVLFRKPGKYRATIHVENTAGYASDKEITFDIAPDESPVAYFAMPIGAYRDPTNGNKAVISIDDMSFSSDKDNITRRIWEYRYDSNNNGSFTDESWVQFSDENKTRLNLELYQVGKYEVRVTVIEEFGQPTIEDFVTDADRLRTSSEATQNVIERIVEVNNRPPEVDWDF
ncbi:hypothetical protein AMQ84_22670 [Paenibacillus riograndensis]|uniref:PKD domain-containing protein n=1 Tax=Paenibacillus riograndensis TaxID=483937 RepID=A0A132TPN5_9BACL|nr:hypothetical protein [Paenibacillus riograndensis]KWX73317.1 hypothetical protein AMQ84_22670 [Paenibacillus riograndensis]